MKTVCTKHLYIKITMILIIRPITSKTNFLLLNYSFIPFTTNQQDFSIIKKNLTFEISNIFEFFDDLKQQFLRMTN